MGFLSNYLFERKSYCERKGERGREGENLQSASSLAGAGLGAQDSMHISHMDAQAQVHGPSFNVFTSTLTASWIRSGVAETMGCCHQRQQFNLLCHHTTSPRDFFLRNPGNKIELLI